MSIPKVVIDTSVMVSVAFAKEGLAKDLRDMIAEGTFRLVTSKEIMAELYKVLRYPRILKHFKPSKDDIDEFIGMIIERALITKGRYKLNKIKDDPADDMFLACALEAKADYIVSRDPHLRNLKQFHGIKIIGVKGFVEKVKGNG
ncbi:MAG: putative toxin-antitoxin system toxin component, PIN family [Desulfobacteraceae bacterium]|jgi:putative PIN family toxin of toxin-antitoxin system|nr:putative toxin-antitoxin system toxin component, PIN family [Desulfobacteraceae bacterium]